MLKSEPLYYLVELARCRSFRIASENLHITQPALSIAIKKLEAELGVTLLERTTKSVHLTEIGEQIVGLSREAIERLEAVEHAVAAERLRTQKVHDVAYDHLQIYTFPALSQGFLGKVLDELCPGAPLNKLIIKDVHFKEMMALLQADDYAFALAWQLRSEQEAVPAEIGFWRLYSTKAQLMLSQESQLVAQDVSALALKSVLTMPLVSYEGGYGINDLMFTLLKKRWGMPTNVIEVPSITLFDQFISSGNAIAFGADLTGWRSLDKSDSHMKNRFIPLKDNIIFDFVLYYNKRCPAALREHVIAVFADHI